MPGSPLTYSVRARAIAAGSAEIDLADQTMRVDNSWGGEPTGLPGPAELLAAAFTSCLLKSLERASQLLDFEYERAEVDVTARREDVPPRFVEIAYEIRIATAEPDRRVDLIHKNLRNFGTVYNTLAAVCDVHGTMVRIEDPA